MATIVWKKFARCFSPNIDGALRICLFVTINVFYLDLGLIFTKNDFWYYVYVKFSIFYIKSHEGIWDTSSIWPEIPRVTPNTPRRSRGVFGVTRGISAKFPKSPPNNPRRSRGLFGGDEGNFDDIKRGGRYRSSHPKYHEAKPSGILDDESGICPRVWYRPYTTSFSSTRVGFCIYTSPVVFQR